MNVIMSSRKERQKGVGMLEVLIAMLVLAIGALGFAGLQITALKNTGDANYRAHATLIAQDAIERIQSNRGQLGHYLTANSWPSAAPQPGASPTDWKKCMTSACSTVEMANWDIAQLSWTAANVMPSGRVLARDCPFNDMSCIILSWEGQSPADCVNATGIKADVGSACLVLEVAL